MSPTKRGKSKLLPAIFHRNKSNETDALDPTLDFHNSAPIRLQTFSTHHYPQKHDQPNKQPRQPIVSSILKTSSHHKTKRMPHKVKSYPATLPNHKSSSMSSSPMTMNHSTSTTKRTKLRNKLQNILPWTSGHQDPSSSTTLRHSNKTKAKHHDHDEKEEEGDAHSVSTSTTILPKDRVPPDVRLKQQWAQSQKQKPINQGSRHLKLYHSDDDEEDDANDDVNQDSTQSFAGFELDPSDDQNNKHNNKHNPTLKQRLHKSASGIAFDAPHNNNNNNNNRRASLLSGNYMTMGGDDDSSSASVRSTRRGVFHQSLLNRQARISLTQEQIFDDMCSEGEEEQDPEQPPKTKDSKKKAKPDPSNTTPKTNNLHAHHHQKNSNNNNDVPEQVQIQQQQNLKTGSMRSGLMEQISLLSLPNLEEDPSMMSGVLEEKKSKSEDDEELFYSVQELMDSTRAQCGGSNRLPVSSPDSNNVELPQRQRVHVEPSPSSSKKTHPNTPMDPDGSRFRYWFEQEDEEDDLADDEEEDGSSSYFGGDDDITSTTEEDDGGAPNRYQTSASTAAARAEARMMKFMQSQAAAARTASPLSSTFMETQAGMIRLESLREDTEEEGHEHSREIVSSGQEEEDHHHNRRDRYHGVDQSFGTAMTMNPLHSLLQPKEEGGGGSLMTMEAKKRSSSLFAQKDGSFYRLEMNGSYKHRFSDDEDDEDDEDKSGVEQQQQPQPQPEQKQQAAELEHHDSFVTCSYHGELSTSNSGPQGRKINNNNSKEEEEDMYWSLSSLPLASFGDDSQQGVLPDGTMAQLPQANEARKNTKALQASARDTQHHQRRLSAPALHRDEKKECARSPDPPEIDSADHHHHHRCDELSLDALHPSHSSLSSRGKEDPPGHASFPYLGGELDNRKANDKDDWWEVGAGDTPSLKQTQSFVSKLHQEWDQHGGPGDPMFFELDDDDDDGHRSVASEPADIGLGYDNLMVSDDMLDPAKNRWLMAWDDLALLN